MKIYFNGCSHTFGDDLADRAHAWPARVAAALQSKFVNDAVSGGTNDRILYRTVKFAQQFDFVCIAWTYTSRFTRYRSDNNHDVNFNAQMTHSMYGQATEFRDYGRLHYTFWHNELYNFKIWLQNVVLLQSYLDSINRPFVMISADHNHINRWASDRDQFNSSVKSLINFDLMSDQQLDDEHCEIQRLLDQVDRQRYYGFGHWWITQLHAHYPVGNTSHLQKAGHQAIADYLLSHDSFQNANC
jgi:hypothetical protein